MLLFLLPALRVVVLDSLAEEALVALLERLVGVLFTVLLFLPEAFTFLELDLLFITVFLDSLPTVLASVLERVLLFFTAVLLAVPL